jgi:CheY-like chemotaxis protein
LAINGRDAMPGGGTLTSEASNVRLEAEYAVSNPEAIPGDYVKFSVTDTGSGMSPEVLGRVMEPFFTTKAPGKGTGLGLSMVHGFAKQSGGHLKIYSEVGFGTTVNLYLPRARSSDQIVGETDVRAVGTHEGNETILVVDDNAEVRKTASMQLTEFGYRVVEAADAKSALDILSNGTVVDLVFSDVVMPGDMTGFELARTVRQNHPGIKIILVTGFAEGALRPEIEIGEPIPILRKPYRRDELASRVRQAFDTAQNNAESAAVKPAAVGQHGEPR